MFERVIAQTIQKITAETLNERSLIPLLDILQDARIPGRIKPFFETEVHWWLYNDALARAANKRFDSDHPELASLLNYIEQVQFRHARFEREEFVAVLDSAVKLIYNYLCRPQTTLKWYIFRGQPVRPLSEVMLRFGAFVDYEYFRTVFTDWVERKRAERPTFDAISATEFERVIRRIDDQILLNCTVEGLLEIMDPLFDFIGEGTEQLIPIDALVIFFDDKNIKKLVDQLENYRERGGLSVGREGFVALLDELLSSTDDEPEVDFSNVYQNDALDEVVREHLQSGARMSSDMEHVHTGAMPAAFEEPVQPEPELESQPELEPESQREPEPAPPPPPPVMPVVEAPEVAPPVAQDDSEIDSPALAPDAPPDAEAMFEEDDTIELEVEEYDAPVLEAEPAIAGDADAVEIEAHLEWDDADDVDFGTGDYAAEPNVAQTEDTIELFDDDDEDDDDDDIETFEAPLNGNASTHAGALAEGGAPDDDTASDTLAHDVAGAVPVVDGVPADGHVVEADAEEEGGEEDLEFPAFDGGAIADGLRAVDRAGAHDTALQFAEPASPPMEDVRRFIDPGLERKVAKKIFAKNRAEYDAALDRINAAATWRAASQVLDEIFIRFDVDPYSRTAIRFTDSVYGRYLPANR